MIQSSNGNSDNVQSGHLSPPIHSTLPLATRAATATSSEPVYSPKKVADAIGVSESSLKRWCDAGYVNATKTAGGHRRVTRSEVISFIKRKNYGLHDPTAIGLPDIRDVKVRDDQDAIGQLVDSFMTGDESTCKQVLVYLFISGRTVPDLFDRIITPAFQHVGDLWKCGKFEVYQERVACQICYNAVLEIRSMIPPAREGAPLAIGCTLEGDHYQLATLGVELSLATHGWRARSLGSNIPLDSLARAAEEHFPRVVWISISHIENKSQFVERMNQFCQRLAPNTTVVLGGKGLSPEIRSHLRNAICCDNFAQLILAVQNLNPVSSFGH